MNISARSDQLVRQIRVEIDRATLIELLDDASAFICELMNVIDEKDGIIDDMKMEIRQLEDELAEERNRE